MNMQNIVTLKNNISESEDALVTSTSKKKKKNCIYEFVNVIIWAFLVGFEKTFSMIYFFLFKNT